MALEKAFIQPLDEKGVPMGEQINVLFNPNEYSIEKSNQFQNSAIPGLAVPITQFVSGNGETLTMELFFDTYAIQQDVREYTGRVTSLMNIDSRLHAPPTCMFKWGDMSFKAVLERVSQKFTMFLESGIPVRATLNVTFKEYKTISEQLHGPNSSEKTRQRIIQQGEQLWHVALREYGDPAKWRLIASFNGIDNPRKIEAGISITVPPLE